MLGLTVGSVDLDRALLHVSVRLKAAPGQRPRLVAGKSEASIRSVPLPDSVAVGIDQHLANCPVLVTTGLDGLLIRNSCGGPVWPRTFDARIWLQATEFSQRRCGYTTFRL